MVVQMTVLLLLAILLLGVGSTFGTGQSECALTDYSFQKSINKISNILELDGNVALIGVDFQFAFADLKGSLSVSNGLDAVVGMNRLRASFPNLPFILTQDWHPKGHISFAETHGKELFTLVQNMTAPGIDEAFDQMLWPVHAVEHTNDAEFHPLLNTTDAIVVKKGTHPFVDSYSGFGDIFHGKYETTILKETLDDLDINILFVCGLATDYCVLNTVLDGIRHGYTVYLVQDCSRGVNPETTNLAIKQMEEAGALII